MTATTQCPPWCSTDHDRIRTHSRLIGHADGVEIHLRQLNGNTVVQLHNTPLAGLQGARVVTEIPAVEAAALAGLMDTLGARDLGTLLRGVDRITRQEGDQ